MNNSIISQNETFGQSESTQAFAKLPKLLITEPQYKHLTAQHILAYTLMRDRLQLSITNQMKDKDGTPFIHYDLGNVAEDIRCGEKKAGQLVNDLDNMGLIRKVRQGLGKPNRIYVHDVFESEPSKRLDRTRSKDGQEPQEEQLKSCQENIAEPSNGQTRPVEGTVPEQSNGQSNKTDKNKTEISNTENSKTEISNTDNSNYSVNGNERALNNGFMTSNAKEYFLTRNGESLLLEVSTLLCQLVAYPHSTICIDNQEMKGYAVSEQLKNISITQIETALNRIEGNEYSEEEWREHMTAELYHVTQETSQQSNTSALAETSEETQVQNRKNFDQTSEESDDLWN